MRPGGWAPARIALASVLLIALLAVLPARHIEAQSPSGGPTATAEATLSPELRAEALRIEHRLLCPLCTNERLDVCENAICEDMRGLIERRLLAGDSPDQIIQFFIDAYGERILAELPNQGFDRWLWLWAKGSVVGVIGIGAWVVWRQSRAPS